MAIRFQFDCVFYYVSDMERAIRFYQDVLGFRFLSRDVVARFDVDGVLFELVPASEPSKAPNGALCLKVEDVEQALKQLRAQGVRTHPARSKKTGTLASFKDPDGNELYLWQYGHEKAEVLPSGFVDGNPEGRT